MAIHELAHAYTHVGFDIDDVTWQTGDLAASDLHVVEGLAQFFTQGVCYRLRNRYPHVLETYQKLLEQQGGPYVAHVKWLDENESGGEAVRAAMILFRSKGEKTLEKFEALIAQQKQLLGRRSKSVDLDKLFA